MGDIKISEDWLAVIVGFIIIALVYFGVVQGVPWQTGKTIGLIAPSWISGARRVAPGAFLRSPRHAQQAEGTVAW